MRVLIQNCLNKKFLSSTKTWVTQIEKAHNFEKTLRAWSEIDEEHLTGVQIILHFGGRAEDVSLQPLNSNPRCAQVARNAS